VFIPPPVGIVPCCFNLPHTFVSKVELLGGAAFTPSLADAEELFWRRGHKSRERASWRSDRGRVRTAPTDPPTVMTAEDTRPGQDK
ncbi:hypothetical protein INR49_020394, partial [Caranx melampygus]